MAIEKIRTRIFATSNLTVSGTFTASGATTSAGTITVTGALVVPYATAAPTLATNGMIGISHVSGTAKLFIKSGGSLYTIALPTAASGGSITVTSA